MEEIRGKWTAERVDTTHIPTTGKMTMDGGAECNLNAGDKLFYDEKTFVLSVKRATTGEVEIVGVGARQGNRVVFLTPEHYEHTFRPEVS
jgi:hypothetical protein